MTILSSGSSRSLAAYGQPHEGHDRGHDPGPEPDAEGESEGVGRRVVEARARPRRSEDARADRLGKAAHILGRGAGQRSEDDDADDECDNADERRPVETRPAAQRPESEKDEPDEEERRANAEPGYEPERDEQQRRDPVAQGATSMRPSDCPTGAAPDGPAVSGVSIGSAHRDGRYRTV